MTVTPATLLHFTFKSSLLSKYLLMNTMDIETILKEISRKGLAS